MWCVRTVVVVMAGQQSRFLARLHVQVLAFVVYEPINGVLFAFWSAAATSGKSLAGRAVDGEGEEVGRFRVVGDEAAVEDEVDENEDVQDEDQKEDGHPCFRGVIDTARGVLLGHDGRVEVLRLCCFER